MAAQISSWSQRSFYNRIVRKVFWNYIYYDLDVNERSEVQAELMGGDEAFKWAQHHADQREIKSTSNVVDFPPSIGSRFHGQLEFHDAFPIFNYLSKILLEQKCGLCIQLGSSSGKEVAYFSSLTKDLKFIGIDLFESATLVAKQRYASSNLEFKTGDFASAYDSITDNKEPVIMFSNGSFLYMFPEHIMAFFAKALSLERPVSIIVSEPVLIRGLGYLLATGKIREEQSSKIKGLSLPCGNMGYSHDYVGYALANGMKLRSLQYSFPHQGSDVVNALFHFSN